MGYTNLLLKYDGDSEAACQNGIAGIIKDKILEVCPFATLISDTGFSAEADERIIFLKMGNSQHLFRIRSNVIGITLMITKLDGTSQMGSSIGTIVTPVYLTIFYGENTLLFYAPTSNSVVYLAYFRDTEDDMYALCKYATASYIIGAPNADTTYTFSPMRSTILLNDTEPRARVLIPARLTDGTSIKSIIPKGNLFIGDSMTTVSMDDEGHFYYSIVGGIAGIMVKDV